MAFCPNCGSQLEENSTFCTNCGTKINNNTTTTTTTDNTTNTQAIAKSLNQINFGKTFNLIKDSAIKPISGGCKFISEANKEETFFVAILFTLVQGIIGMWKVSILYNLIKESTSSLSSLIYKFADISIPTNIYLNIPYGKIFLQNCALYLVFTAIIFLCIFLFIGKIFQTEKESFSFFKVALISTLPFLISELISLIFAYFSILLAAIILIFGIIFSIALLTLLIKNTYSIGDDKIIFIVSISCIIAFIILLLIYKQIVISNIKDISSRVINHFSLF